MMSTWNPFRGQIADPIDQVFNNVLRDMLEDGPQVRRAQTWGSQMMRVDMVEDPAAYHICADLPGFEKTGVDINIENNNGTNMLTITACKSPKVMQEGEHFLCKERPENRLQRSFRLPVNADIEHAGTCMANGVLCLTFPKITSPSQGFKRLAIA